jgi:hypothetical protein
MNQYEIQAVRKLLFFSVEEAATLVANVQPRTWQRWEDGTRNVPEDVAHKLCDLLAWRSAAILAAETQIDAAADLHGEAERITLFWFESLADWLGENPDKPEYWRPHQSVLAAVSAAKKCAIVLRG